jgi:hypothetical protein
VGCDAARVAKRSMLPPTSDLTSPKPVPSLPAIIMVYLLMMGKRVSLCSE